MDKIACKMIRPYGHYHEKDEVNLDPNRAKMLINGGYAEPIDPKMKEEMVPKEYDVRHGKKMEPKPENKGNIGGASRKEADKTEGKKQAEQKERMKKANAVRDQQ